MEKYYKENEEAIKEFEKLGYTYSFDDGYIEYSKEKPKNEYKAKPYRISFNVCEPEVSMVCNDMSEKHCSSVDLDISLLKAIDKQCSMLWKSYKGVNKE